MFLDFVMLTCDDLVFFMPKAKMVSKELESETIVVFDEAHNIDSVCIEALSVTINERGLEQATRSLGRLSSEVSRLKASDSQRLQNEYQNLVSGLIEQGLLDAPANDVGMASVSPIAICCSFSMPVSHTWSPHVSFVRMYSIRTFSMRLFRGISVGLSILSAL